MASVKALSKLLSALAREDLPGARAVAETLVTTEERRGHYAAARALRGALHPNEVRHTNSGIDRVHIFGDPGLLNAALTPLTNGITLADVTLTPPVRRSVELITREWRHRSALEAHGLPRRTKLLFCGPPGCGKSMTARALAADLDVSAYVVRMDAIVGAYLGQTASRVRELFRFAEEEPCVMLIDEIDAIGKARGNQSDVGELDRIVITLMQELEHSSPKGLLIATSNLGGRLDQALLRRFDDMLLFKAPSQTALRKFARERLSARGIVSARGAERLAIGASNFAEVERRVTAAERQAFLDSLGAKSQ